MELIKKNFYYLCMCLGAVSIALVAASFISRLGNDIDSDIIVYDLYLLLVIIADVVIILSGTSRRLEGRALSVAVLSFALSKIILNLYYMIKLDYSWWGYSYDVLIDITVIVLVLISISQKRFNMFTFVFLLIMSAFELASAFSGSTIGLGRFITCVIMTAYYWMLSHNEYNYNNDYLS